MDELRNSSKGLTSADLACLMQVSDVMTGLVYGEVLLRADRRPDFRLIKANRYFEQLTHSLAGAQGDSELESWLGIAPEQLEAVNPWEWSFWTGNTHLEVDARVPLLGKTFHLVFKLVANNRFLATVVDVTENRHHEQEVLEANMQLRRLKESTARTNAALSDEWQQLLCATVLRLQPLGDCLAAAPKGAVSVECLNLLKSVSTGLTEHYLMTPPSTSLTLVSMSEVYREVYGDVTAQYPEVTLTHTTLPTIVGDQQAVKSILFNLLSVIAQYTQPGGVVRLTYDAEKLESSFMVRADKLKAVDNELSFMTIETDLRLLLFRRQVLMHGGCFEIFNPQPDTLTVRFWLGCPTGSNRLTTGTR